MAHASPPGDMLEDALGPHRFGGTNGEDVAHLSAAGIR